MKFLRKFFLRSPEAVYRAYAWKAGAQFVLHAFMSVLVASTPAAILLVLLTKSMLIVLTSSLFLTILFVRLLGRFMGGIAVGKKVLYGDATIDRKLTDMAAPICRKAGIAPIPVIRSADQAEEGRMKRLRRGLYVVITRQDVWERYDDERSISGIIAHEVGHLCVPCWRFVRMEIGIKFLWPIDLCSWRLGELAARCLNRDAGCVMKVFMLWSAVVLHLSARCLWHVSRSRVDQLNEYAADCYGAFLLGDALPIAQAMAELATFGGDLGEEGEVKLVPHPPLISRANRLLDMHFLAHNAR